jgi:hypothetical protein
VSPVIKYDASDVEAGGGGVQPEPGLYRGKINSAAERKKKQDGTPCHDLEVTVDVGEGMANLWTYIPLKADAPNKWKLREFTDALGLPPKGGVDTNKIKGKEVNVKVVADTDKDGDYKGKIKNIFLPVDTDEIVNLNGAGPGGDDGEVTDYSDWTDDDLKAELKEREITVPGRFSTAKAIAALEEADAEGDEPEAEEEAEEPEEETTAGGDTPDIPEELLADLKEDPDFYAEWPDEDVKSYVADLDLAIPGRYSRKKAIDAFVALAGSLSGEEETATEADGDDYDTWEDDDLKQEIKDRVEQGSDIKVPGRWTRDKAIKVLRGDDAPF